MRFERGFAVLLALAAVGLLVLAWGYTAPLDYDSIGPRPFPVLILGLLLVGAVCLAIFPEQGLDVGMSSAFFRKLILCVLCLFAYAALFEVLGFPLATVLVVFAMGRLFGGSMRASLLTGVVLGLGFYVLFDQFLDVTLPFAGIFKG